MYVLEQAPPQRRLLPLVTNSAANLRQLVLSLFAVAIVTISGKREQRVVF